MDADDISKPNRIDKQFGCLSEHPECVALGSQVMLIDPEGLEICQFVATFSHSDIDSAHLAGQGGSICHLAMVMRSAAVDKVGGYRTKFPYAEDIDLFLRLAEIGTLSNLSDTLFRYRQHPKSIGYQYASTQQTTVQRAVVEARLRRGLTISADSNRSDAAATEVTPLGEVHNKWVW